MDKVTETAEDPAVARARTEVALVALLSLLLVPAFVPLFFAETVLPGRMVGVGHVALAALVPLFSLKFWLHGRPPAGIAVTVLACGISAAVTTQSTGITLICMAFGLIAAVVFYRVQNNTAYRPRMIGEKR